MAQGLVFQNLLGGQLTDETLNNSFLQNNYRFLATTWLGYAPLLLLFSTDIKRYGTALKILFGMAIIGGLARLLTFAQFGFPEDRFGFIFLVSATIAELIILPIVLYSHWELMTPNELSEMPAS